MTLNKEEGWKHPKTHEDAMVSTTAKSICWPPNVCDLEQNHRKARWLRPFRLAPLLRIALRSRQGVHSGIPDGASLPGLVLGLPQHVNLFQCKDRGSERQRDITNIALELLGQ